MTRRGGIKHLASASVVIAIAVAAVSAQDDKPAKTADELLAAIEKARIPTKPSPKNARLLKTYPQRRNRALAERARLIGELLAAAPDRESLVELLPERWDTLCTQGVKNPKQLATEIRAVLEGPLGTKLKLEATYYLAVVAIQAGDLGLAQVPEEAEAFLALAPQDPRGAILLYQTGKRLFMKRELQKQAFDRVLKSYPDTDLAKRLKTELTPAGEIGSPFAIAFTDVVSGREVSNRTLKGKVLVIDFWATWCGPCVAELPKMKELYAKYRPLGVEFVGVSLDQPESKGGLDALTKFLVQNAVPWPQYYQGNGWESEFSARWGIHAIPAVFVVDKAGLLVSRERGASST